MKLQILQEKLKKGLNIAGRVASKSLSLPVLNNILVSCEKNFLNLAATDLEIGVNLWELAKSDKEGKITVPAHLFSGFVSLLPNKKIEIEAVGDSLKIECEKYKTQIKGISADEFPIIPKIDEGEFVELNASLFCQNIAQVVDIAALSTTRPEISGVYLLFQEDQITMAATDSFRLGEKKIFPATKFNIAKEYSLIIPQRAIKEVINIFGEYNKNLKIYFSANQAMFEIQMDETSHPQIQVISRLIEGEYPNYKDIIPQQHSTKITVDKNEFANQIKTASFFAGKTNEVKLKASKDEITITSQSPDIGNHESSISAKIDGEPIEVAFNYKYVLDGIANIKSAEVSLDLNGDSGPGVMRPVGDNSYLYVVMPIKAN